LHPFKRPPDLVTLPEEDLRPPGNPLGCAARLLAMLVAKKEEFEAETDRLEQEEELPDLRDMIRTARMLSDADNWRVVRCHAEQRLTLDRNLKVLQKELEAEWDEDDPEDQKELTGSSGSEAPNDGAGAANEPARLAPAPVAAPAPDSGGGGEEPAVREGSTESPSEPRTTSEQSTQVAETAESPIQKPSADPRVPFCARETAAGPPPDPQPEPPPPALLAQFLAARSRLRGPRPARGSLWPPGMGTLYLLALGCLALRARQEPGGCVKRTINLG
jgi:hypothetical protein